jgi:iron complex transport system substrate-binding protein
MEEKMKPDRRFFVIVMVVALLATLSLVIPTLAQDAAFTIQADADLQVPLTALYGAMYDGAAPVFADADGDLLATTDAAAVSAVYDGLPKYFLPDAALVPQSDSADASAFIDFAISPDGQQVLIDEGLLPAVVTVTDQAGNTLEIPQPVRRAIVSYGPAVYFLYGVGAQDRLVAANYLGGSTPSAAAAMSRIDPRFEDIVSTTMTTKEINVEEVAQLEPDMLFTSPRSPYIETVQELGVQVFLYNAELPDAIKEAMLTTGQIFGPNTAAQAQAWVDYYDSVVESYAALTADMDDADRVSALFTGTDPLRVASGEMYQSYIIEAAGGISASGELTGYWNDVNLEQIAVWDPDMIFVPPYGGATVKAITDNLEWKTLFAVKNGQVYRFPQLVAPWDTPGPDSVLAIIWTAQLLYPGLGEFDCPSQTSYFYNTFYGYAISGDEVAEVCGW